ncbi:hypothetical protein T02_15832 [Trichinella nativa]|uniref:Uncharacterized protein n=1 Tax=Trichinella nativa TaxID=6335 RepID=A0A0V1KYE6_9BILA|nr:hypothetical protein T02_15832 [Trichinella nativa]
MTEIEYFIVFKCAPIVQNSITGIMLDLVRAALEYISAFEQVWSHSATAVTMEYVNTTDRFYSSCQC